MSIDLEHIRSRNPIEDVVNEKVALRKTGNRYVGIEHDSLVVTPRMGYYFWNSHGEFGDVFDFTGRYLLNYGTTWNNRDTTMFMESVRYLAQRAGLTLETNTDLKQSVTWAERQLVSRLHESLLNHKAAFDYVTYKRGWQTTTIRAARLGFMPQDRRKLLADLNLTDSWRSVVNKFPTDMLVYPHFEKGRLVYLSGRSIEGKRHYNPPSEIIGERHPYLNTMYSDGADQVIVVEGQADAVTFAEWGIPAVAIGGMTVNDDLINKLRGHRRLFVGLDNTTPAMQKALEIARLLYAETYIFTLPTGIKDANEWLVQSRATAEDAANLLNKARNWLEVEIMHTASQEGLARQDGLRDLFKYAVDLDDFALAEFKSQMGKVGIKGRIFSDLLKAAQAQSEKREQAENDMPQILGDDVPLLSPALGFQRDVALVTIALIERTKDNRLHTQPYLVTGTRELRRLTDEQIIQLNGHEVALRVIPEGSEFLMRWRFGDIQRFLNSETVAPPVVFNTIHDLFTTYLDFKTPVESRVLTLWVIGTYLYTMFPAYPYLALTGPKNSGKSTVLRVAQPLAFNMVNTSDPSGSSMFRLIHTTSCTVGIDEAERFHNPKDPGMQQIRQLLNSGYKQGMPAIRVAGDDLKPQAFDVYSPKILAAIAGLEDILASRCIALPMRRTDRKLPTFPADFDAAAIRHMLYTLALTYFQTIYRNYFERPELHTLHNRSGELWSPLVALAAFFEESGISGLLGAISEAASWDEQFSQGNALSDREEAVLQALDLLSRGSSGLVWIRGANLRERVAALLGQPIDRMGDSQWIGHILKRLHLADEGRRKRSTDGMSYAIQPEEVLDMMRRYDVQAVDELKA